jgi:biopolymer transport protein ExbD
MSITFDCPWCGKRLSAKPSLAGREMKCPKCRGDVKVPLESKGAKQGHAQEHGHADHGMLLAPSKHGHEDLVDMTAMVDIVFFLLIFFMVTSITAQQSVIGLPSPESSSSAPSTQAAPDFANDPSFINVAIEADDTVWVEDEQVFGRQDLRVKLRSIRDGDFQPSGMMITGSPEASHGQLVMVLDAGADAGLGELRFTVSDATDMSGK